MQLQFGMRYFVNGPMQTHDLANLKSDLNRREVAYAVLHQSGNKVGLEAPGPEDRMIVITDEELPHLRVWRKHGEPAIPLEPGSRDFKKNPAYVPGLKDMLLFKKDEVVNEVVRTLGFLLKKPARKKAKPVG